MSRIILTLSLILFFEITNSQTSHNFPDTTGKSTDPIRAEKAKSVVLKYIHLIAKGENIDSIMNMCSVPFALDRKEIISERAALKQKYVEMIADKGKNRVFSVDTIFIRTTRKEILDNIIPLDVYYVVVKIKLPNETKEDTHGILLAVQMSDNPKIIGFSD